MRIFHDDLEITKELIRLNGVHVKINYAVGDFIYIASDLPFNHFFLKIHPPKNNISANMKVEYYGSKWDEVVDLKDETNALFNDGFVEFTPNKNASWSMVSSSVDFGLTKVVYDKYWIRISFDATLKANCELSFLGNKFSDDIDLFHEYPIFNNTDFLTAFEAGKVDWEVQHVKAAEVIISDLIKRRVIIAPEQILDRRKFIGASVCKVAEIIYSAFGNDYLTQKKEAYDEYHRRLDISQYSVDTNNNAILEPVDTQTRQGWLSR
jgi:hypothetical protein